MQRLRITLHGATGLQTVIDGLPDAYVLGEIPGKPWTRSRTKAARQGLDPTWDEVLEMDDVGSEMLELKVVDERAAGVDEGLLGAVLLRAQDFGPRGRRGEWPLVLAGAEGLPPGARPPALQLSVAVEFSAHVPPAVLERRACWYLGDEEVGSCYTGGGGADGRPPGHAEEPLLERAWSEAVAAEQAVEHAFRGGAVAAERAAVGAIHAAEGAVSRAAAALGSVGHIGELFHLHGGGGAGAAERGAESASHSASPAAEGAASRAAAALGSLGHEMGELFHHTGGACAPPLDTLPPGAFDGDMLPPVGTLPHGAFQDLASTANSDGLSLGPPTGTMPPGAFEAALRAAAPPSSSSRPPSPPSAPPAPGGAGVHRLRVSVVSAKGLRNADWFGKSDPYCICEVPGSLQSRFTTDVVDDCLEPVWNKTVEFDWHRGAPLEFTVMDKDVWPKEDDLLGRATLPSERFFPFGFDGDLPLAMSGEQEALLQVEVQVVERGPHGGAAPGSEAPSCRDGGRLGAAAAAAPPAPLPRRLRASPPRRPAAEPPPCGAARIRVRLEAARGVDLRDRGGGADLYCVCGVAGRPASRFQTRGSVGSSAENPRWDHEQEVAHHVPGDSLEFTLVDCLALPQPDGQPGPCAVVGTSTLRSEQFYPHGFDAELTVWSAGLGIVGLVRVRVTVLEGAAARPLASSPRAPAAPVAAADHRARRAPCVAAAPAAHAVVGGAPRPAAPASLSASAGAACRGSADGLGGLAPRVVPSSPAPLPRHAALGSSVGLGALGAAEPVGTSWSAPPSAPARSPAALPRHAAVAASVGLGAPTGAAVGLSASVGAVPLGADRHRITPQSSPSLAGAAPRLLPSWRPGGAGVLTDGVAASPPLSAPYLREQPTAVSSFLAGALAAERAKLAGTQSLVARALGSAWPA